MLDEAYRSQWFEQDEEYKKILKIFMERIKGPIRISAMGMLDINLQTFLSVITRDSFVKIKNVNNVFYFFRFATLLTRCTQF
jgi:7tm Odorant receptor